MDELGLGGLAASDMSVEHAHRLAAVLDQDVDLGNGAALPLLWHWAFFAPLAAAAGLGPDGHPRMPSSSLTAGLSRRMWGGSRVKTRGPLRIGVGARRRSNVLRAERKPARSGELLLVTVEHRFEQESEVVLVEEQDLVYLPAAGPKHAAPGGDQAPPPRASDWSEVAVADEVTLFRFSALTFNGHRIHYDLPYATGVEGYPGLVVHGPLTAILLAEAARRHSTGRATGFSFRGTAPLFAGAPIELRGTSAGDDVELEAIRSDGVTAVSALLTLAR